MTRDAFHTSVDPILHHNTFQRIPLLVYLVMTYSGGSEQKKNSFLALAIKAKNKFDVAWCRDKSNVFHRGFSDIEEESRALLKGQESFVKLHRFPLPPTHVLFFLVWLSPQFISSDDYNMLIKDSKWVSFPIMCLHLRPECSTPQG